MEKRLPLALFLSFLVLFGYMLLFGPKREPVEGVENGKEAGAVEPGPVAVEQPEVPEAPVPERPPPSLADDFERELSLEVGQHGSPGHYFARFSNRGARLVELRFGDYFTTVGLDEAEREDTSNWLPLVEPVETAAGTTGSLLFSTSSSSEELAPGGLEDALWKMEELEQGDGVAFSYGPGTGVLFRKTISFEPGTWRILMRLEIENQDDGPPGTRDFLLTPAGCVPPELGDRFYQEPKAVAVGRKGDDLDLAQHAARKTKAPDTLKVPTPLVFGGVHNKYFAFLIRDADDGQHTLMGARYRPVTALGETDPRFIELDIPLSLQIPPVGQSRAYDYVVYAGPKDHDDFVGDLAAHQAVLDKDLSTFATIGKALLAVLGLFHAVVGNWGLAIILLTICVRGLLFPLNRRSQTAMARYQKKMKRVQPRLEEIKKRYANDSQKQREAQARIMQEEGAFPPLGGCLPIFFQLPIFFGLFSALRTSFDLRQAPFYGWITDLSRPDRLMRLDLKLPGFLPNLEYLNVLPILMVVMWVLQQRGMPKPADEQAARMQKMMAFMPILFGFMLYNYAAGLSLYMMTTSTIGIIEQRVIKKVWPIDDTEPEKKKKKKSGCGPFSGIMQNMADKQREQMKRMQAMQAEQRRQAQRKKKRRGK